MMNKRLENKIDQWYGKSIQTRWWLAKRWYKFITYGCDLCWRENCGHAYKTDKHYEEMAEYAYVNYEGEETFGKYNK